MADAVATQILFDGDRKAIMKFTNISDGTGETKVAKVIPGNLKSSYAGKACTAVTITKIYAMTHGMEVAVYWDATTDVLVRHSAEHQLCVGLRGDRRPVGQLRRGQDRAGAVLDAGYDIGRRLHHHP